MEDRSSLIHPFGKVNIRVNVQAIRSFIVRNVTLQGRPAGILS